MNLFPEQSREAYFSSKLLRGAPQITPLAPLALSKKMERNKKIKDKKKGLVQKSMDGVPQSMPSIILVPDNQLHDATNKPRSSLGSTDMISSTTKKSELHLPPSKMSFANLKNLLSDTSNPNSSIKKENKALYYANGGGPGDSTPGGKTSRYRHQKAQSFAISSVKEQPKSPLNRNKVNCDLLT